MSEDQSPSLSVQIRTPWPLKVSTPVLAANRFALQVSPPEDPLEVILTVGHLSQPLFSGSREEQQRQAEELGAWEIAVLGRYSVRLEKLLDLYEVLGRLIAELQPDSEEASNPAASRKASE